HRVDRLPIVPAPSWPVRWIFATGASLAPLIYQIPPARPGKLVNGLRIAENPPLVGAHAFFLAERPVETTNQIACTARHASLVEPDRGRPLEREVLEHRPEYGVGVAQVGAADRATWSSP